MSKEIHGVESNVSPQEDQKKPENNRSEAVVKPTSELLNSSMGVGANNSAANDTTAVSTENLNGNVTTNEVDQSKISGDKKETFIKLNTSTDNSSETLETPGNNSTTETGTKNGRRLLEDSGSKSAEGLSDNKDSNEGDRMATVENDGGLEAEADSAFDFLRDNDEIDDEFSYDYDDYIDEGMWGDEEWVEGQHQNSEDYVNIDAHIGGVRLRVWMQHPDAASKMQNLDATSRCCSFVRLDVASRCCIWMQLCSFARLDAASRRISQQNY